MAAHSKLTDQELSALLKSGDREAFTQLYHRYQPLLYLFALKLTRDPQEAEDIVQEILIYLWDKRETLVFSSGIKSYLYSAVRYKFFDLLDHKKVISTYEASFSLVAEKAAFITDELVREKELTRLIELEVEKLPPKMRQVFQMSRNQHLSPKEIAEQLQISDKTVRKQINSAVTTLKLKLGSLFSVLLSGFF